jgi:hypothetical protein
LVISYVLDLPFGRGKKYLTDATGFVDKVVGGWSVDGITIFQKGFPLAFGNAIPNYITSYGGGSRPNVVAGCNSQPMGASQHFRWRLNLRAGLKYLPRHEPAPHPVRTQIHVLDLGTPGMAVQSIAIPGEFFSAVP